MLPPHTHTHTRWSIHPQFVDLFDTAYSFILASSWAGVIGFLCCVKIFQLLSLSRMLNVLWATLFRAAKDLVAFVVSLMIVVFGFAFWGQMSFGYLLEGFRSYGFAVSTLLRYPLGDFEYDDLSRVSVHWMMIMVCVTTVCTPHTCIHSSGNARNGWIFLLSLCRPHLPRRHEHNHCEC